MSELTLNTKQVGEVTVLYPSGHINAHTVQVFEGRLQDLIKNGSCRIVVHGKDLQYISSAGLGALMGVIEDIRANQGDIRLSGLSESVYSVFDILGFTHLFKVFPSEDDALQSFKVA